MRTHAVYTDHAIIIIILKLFLTYTKKKIVKMYIV